MFISIKNALNEILRNLRKRFEIDKTSFTFGCNARERLLQVINNQTNKHAMNISSQSDTPKTNCQTEQNKKPALKMVFRVSDRVLGRTRNAKRECFDWFLVSHSMHSLFVLMLWKIVRPHDCRACPLYVCMYVCVCVWVCDCVRAKAPTVVFVARLRFFSFSVLSPFRSCFAALSDAA